MKYNLEVIEVYLQNCKVQSMQAPVRQDGMPSSTPFFFSSSTVLVLYFFGQQWAALNSGTRCKSSNGKLFPGSPGSHRGKVFPVTPKSRKFFSYCGSSTDSFSHCTESSVVQLCTASEQRQ